MADHRNLVFIMSDQQRYDTFACYGNEWIQTPHLNALADESFVFERAYVTQPVCTPARASIMTDLYPHIAGPIVNQMILSPEVPTIAEMVSDDYLRGYMGKWHLGDDVVRQHGFDVWVSTEDGHRESYTRPEYLDIYSDYHQHVAAGGLIYNDKQRSLLLAEFQMATFWVNGRPGLSRKTLTSPSSCTSARSSPTRPTTGQTTECTTPRRSPRDPSS